jgi:spermidine/putrescine transport system substrate-binding protein
MVKHDETVGERRSAETPTSGNELTGTGSHDRRTFLATATAAGLATTADCLSSVTGGGGGGGQPDFVRYIGWGGNTQDSARQLFDQWAEETGIEVQRQTAGGDSAIVSQINQNPGSFDFANLSSYGITLARNQDLLGAVNYDQLPNYTENMQEAFRNAPYIQQGDESDTIFRDRLHRALRTTPTRSTGS